MKKKTVSRASVKKNKQASVLKKEIEHDYTCDNCGKPAEYNVQNWFRSYSIDNDGDFQEINDWEGDSNEFYCKKCAEAEGLA